MKKIDFHIHTTPVGGKDAKFEFDLEKFQEYINFFSLDAIAITNHNIFDLEQFRQIQKLENVIVFPGIEIDFKKGQLLLISDSEELDEFDSKCKMINEELKKNKYISVEKLREIFNDLNEYLLIPHYDKDPKVPIEAINSLGNSVFVGEVSSPKKFFRAIKDSDFLTPVVFSDARICTGLDFEKYQGRHTFVKTNTISLTFNSIKVSLRDKNKVFLTKTGKPDFFQVLTDGQELSTALNVVIGGRSSGKTHFLDQMAKSFEREEKSVKYIKQFELIKDDEKEFSAKMEEEKGAVKEEYLKEFRSVVEDVSRINLGDTNYKMEQYVETLLHFASSEKLQDDYSKAILFKSNQHTINNNQAEELENLLEAVIRLQENKTHKDMIAEYVPQDILKKLFDVLASEYKKTLEETLKKKWVNDLTSVIKGQLEGRTASPVIKSDDIDFYQIKLEQEQMRKFDTLVKEIMRKREIRTETFGKFKIKASTSPYLNASEMRKESKNQGAFTDAFKKYARPIDFFEELRSVDGLEKGELYKYFCKVTYQVLNEYDTEVSGGEMAEFNLLEALHDARQYEMLLIDEPESSFDNLFLKDNVNQEIKELSKDMPIIVVTHNNTVGMLLYPDYFLYTQRKITDGKPKYSIFSGSLGDKEFKTADEDESIKTHEILLDTFEAGEIAYNDRKGLYDSSKE